MKFELKKNTKVTYQGKVYKVRRVVSSLTQIIAEHITTGKVEAIPIAGILPFDLKDKKLESDEPTPVEALTDEELKQAKSRLQIIKPFLRGALRTEIEKAARRHRIGVSTLYRWRKQYLKTGLLTSLVDKPGRGGKDLSRLKPKINKIVTEVITSLMKQNKSLPAIYREVSAQCNTEKLKTPHLNTIRLRIDRMSGFEKTILTRGKRKADEIFNRKNSNVPQALYPLHIVKIDHTKLDVVLVDDDYREVLCRPWLTLLIDVYSRMPIGYYLSQDPPGNFGTGCAIVNALLTKDKLLAALEIDSEWPCWGAMEILQADNAGEFHSEMLENAAKQYNITLNFRPKKKPHYGGHIERLLGTFNKEIHDLPGTTFSSSQQRKFFDYDSEKRAAFTLKELEEWLVTYMTMVYMKRPHSSLGISPLEQYRIGIMGSKDKPGRGVPPIFSDEAKLSLDFMPYFKRTVQPYGVEINGIKYFKDVLRKWINYRDPAQSKKSKEKKKFIFKFDPRDISKIYFMDPDTKLYYKIPYYDVSGPPMSIWEHRKIKRQLKTHGSPVSERDIFLGYERMKEIEERSIKTTKQTRRNRQRRKDVRQDKKLDSSIVNDERNVLEENYNRIIQPFEGLDHEAFN